MLITVFEILILILEQNIKWGNLDAYFWVHNVVKKKEIAH